MIIYTYKNISMFKYTCTYDYHGRRVKFSKPKQSIKWNHLFYLQIKINAITIISLSFPNFFDCKIIYKMFLEQIFLYPLKLEKQSESNVTIPYE